MFFEKDEILFFLNMYPTALKKKRQISYKLFTHKKNETLLMYDHFYSVIIENVEKWLDFIEIDERELIQFRFFKKKTWDDIAAFIGYQNHSSVIYKYRQIIRKIERTVQNESWY